ncbi:hypothetical protein SLEP1_g58823 [Rubroshorea leprosula]|uniref:Uncharacterized protein n=1 Tax=Rubroshorea leprosula TaxID=152421 RepID=A0AAV5MRR7_9ROSI|nr:hypothetical protein SLEP1_g58823 [Rubroshorea leprosula]
MLQGPCRALLADLSANNHKMMRTANGWFSFFMAVGNVLAYAAGSYSKLYKILPFTKPKACVTDCTNLKSCFVIDIILHVGLPCKAPRWVFGVDTPMLKSAIIEAIPLERRSKELRVGFNYLFGMALRGCKDVHRNCCAAHHKGSGVGIPTVAVMQLLERKSSDLSFTSVIKELLSYVQGWAPRTYPYTIPPRSHSLVNDVVRGNGSSA